MKASELMTRSVVTVGQDATIAEAIRLMLEHRISGLPVVDSGNRLAGIVTEGDLLRRGEMGTERQRPHWLEFLLGSGRLAADYVHTHARKVTDVMTPEVEAVSEGASAREIVDLMERRHVKRLPVVRDGILVGIVSRADLLHGLAPLADASPVVASDADILARVQAEIDKQPWTPHATMRVSAKGGVVHLSGTVFDEREREALHVLAANTPGVKRVEDYLLVIEPISGLVIAGGPLDEEKRRAEESRKPN